MTEIAKGKPPQNLNVFLKKEKIKVYHKNLFLYKDTIFCY